MSPCHRLSKAGSIMALKKRKTRSSSGSREAKRSSTLNSLEPLEQVSKVREGGAKRFASGKKNVNLDIEQNVREIRALLTTNREILERCSESVCDRIRYRYGYGNSSTRTRTFKRAAYNEVYVGGDGCGSVDICTEEVETQKDFELTALQELPKSIGGLFVEKKMSGPNAMDAIDYGALFETSLMLDDEVLEPFLAKLKDHLMNVQVCLGRIDEWVMQPHEISRFLEETFQVKLADLSHNYRYGKKLLKTYNDGGTYSKTFCMSDENSRKKLKKFLLFISDEE